MKKYRWLVILIFLIFYGCGQQQGSPGEVISEVIAEVVTLEETEEETDQPPFAFLFFGCTQANPATDYYGATGILIGRAVELAAISPTLAIFGGDSVNDGGDPYEWQLLWDAIGNGLDGITTAAVAGNHDNHRLLVEQFDYPTWTPEAHGDGFFYSLDMGEVYFLMLDSNIMGAGRQVDVDWLRDTLSSERAQSARWRIAVMHHPMWPVIVSPRDAIRAETKRRYFLPLLEEYDVSLILCAHQHNYARTYFMSGDAVSEDDNGIVQIMVATGGKDTYAIADYEHIAVNADAPNYLLIVADGESITITAYGRNKEAIDTFIIY